MSLATLQLRDGRRSGDADPELVAGVGSDPPFRDASIGIGEGAHVHAHATLRRGVAPSHGSLREGIHAHAVRVDSSSMFAGFLFAHPVDYAFVCIDQLIDSDSPRQDVVYSALSEAGVPFIDSGVSITLDNGAVRGVVTTSAYAAGCLKWKDAVPNARVHGDHPGYRNVQLPEVNALAAALAVMEWRRRTGQYVSDSTSFLHKFRLETPRVVAHQTDSQE